MAESDDEDELARRRRKREESVETSKQPEDQTREVSPKSTVRNDRTARMGLVQRSYRAGDIIVCRIIVEEPGGYGVKIDSEAERGFLPTQKLLTLGTEVEAQFVCIHKGRVLLSARFSKSQMKLPNIEKDP